jgi:energy-coupling factor transporter ATP-binding protein EcfA2
MVSLLEVLGRTAVADELERKLLDRQICWVSGPSGSGKTELSRHIASLWSRDGGDAYWIVGDKDQLGTSYLAAHRALAGSRPRRSAREADRDLPTAVLRGLPWVGGPISALARTFIARAEFSGPDFLATELQDLLSGFQRVCLGEKLLFIIDNAHWLDVGTADLLARMGSPEVLENYPFATRASYLFIETADQDQVAASSASFASLKGRAATRVTLSFPTRDQFPAVLQSLGLTQVPAPEVCDRLYGLTRGHLKLAKEIVRLLEEDGPSADVGKEQIATPAEMAARLLEMRLESLAPSAPQIQKLLGIASCIGQSFSRRELECAYASPADFALALEIARREEFLSGEGDALQFAHDIVQTALRALGTSEAASFHDKLAECVRLIRPGDYRRRLRHALLADRPQRAASLAFALLLQEHRGEIVLEQSGDRPSEDALGEHRAAFAAAREALFAMDNGRHGEAIRLLVLHYDGGDGLVQGELAYLIALNYYKKRTRADYENARALLEAWIARRDEGEVWHRLMLTLAVVYASLADQRGSSETLTRVRTFLEQSAFYDSSARAKIQILNRKADVFYPLEVAGVLIEKAVQYFAPPAGTDMPRNAFQYAAALINLSGNAFLRGEFATSHTMADAAVRFISLFSVRMRVPEAYKAFNNYAIAAVRAARITPHEGWEILDTMARAVGESDRLDYSLLSANRGALALLAGRLEEADALLARTYEACKHDGVEGYYLLFAASNFAVSQYIRGARARATELLNEVDACLWEIPGEMRRSIEMRQQCMRQAIRDNAPPDAAVLDAYPVSVKGPDGPHLSWRALGRGLIMSDIQVWSES